MIDREKFFPSIRATVFGGRMDQSQVDGLNAILDAWEAACAGCDIRWLVYMLATAFHETNATMVPVREAYWLDEIWRKDNLRYYPFYGRGYVQLTWRENYQQMSAVVDVNLVATPDGALEPAIAAKVMFYGMEHGSFTGRKLSDYINAAGADYLNARRIINGTDCAAKIAAYAVNFASALAA